MNLNKSFISLAIVLGFGVTVWAFKEWAPATVFYIVAAGMVGTASVLVWMVWRWKGVSNAS